MDQDAAAARSERASRRGHHAGRSGRASQRLNAESPRPKRLFNDLQFGSYLQFAAPEQKVFVDTRMDFYPYELFREYIDVSSGLDVGAFVEQWGIDAMLLDKTSQAPLAKKVHGDPSWTIRHEDEDEHALFVVRTRRSE